MVILQDNFGDHGPICGPYFFDSNSFDQKSSSSQEKWAAGRGLCIVCAGEPHVSYQRSGDENLQKTDNFRYLHVKDTEGLIQ